MQNMKLSIKINIEQHISFSWSCIENFAQTITVNRLATLYQASYMYKIRT